MTDKNLPADLQELIARAEQDQKDQEKESKDKPKRNCCNKSHKEN